MSIKKSVGAKGENQRVDAKVIQAALNLSQSATFKLEKNLTVDGSVGKKTIEAIELFQSNVECLAKPDGRIDPNGRTLQELKSRVTKGLTEDALVAIMGHG